MTALPYTTKTGKAQFKPLCSSEEVNDGTLGFCLACGQDVLGVEPDGRKYKCEVCGKPKVYGLAELLLMGLVELREEA